MTKTTDRPAPNQTPETAAEIRHSMRLELRRLREVNAELLEAMDPETLEAIAVELGDEFKHSARAASLMGIARRQRAIIARAKKA